MINTFSCPDDTVVKQALEVLGKILIQGSDDQADVDFGFAYHVNCQ